MLYVFASIIPLFLFIIVPVLISEATGGFTKRYTANSFRSEYLQNKGNVAIVTGGNTGIGFETAKQLALNGANVILTARSEAKGKDAVSRIMEASEANDDTLVRYMICDQNSLKSIQNFVSKFRALKLPSINLLVLNAGVMKSPGAQFIGKNLTYGFDLTDDGFEQHIGVNHIAHFYLTNQLEKELISGASTEAGSRVVSVSSMAHSGAFFDGIRPETWSPTTSVVAKTDKEIVVPDWYEDGTAYGQSKLANILFARELASRMSTYGVNAYSLHPGIIQSDLARYMAPVMQNEEGKSFLEKMISSLFVFIWNSSNMNVLDGSLTTLYLSTAPTKDLVNGGYYLPIGVLADIEHPAWKKDDEEKNGKLQKMLWTETEKAIESVLKRN